MNAYGRMAELYDRFMADMPYHEMGSFITQVINKFGSGNIQQLVDIGCGTGTITLLLAAEGYQVTGMDISEAMLAIARQKSLHTRLAGTVCWVQQDMRQWAVPEAVDVIVSCCDSVNYITSADDIIQFFKITAQNLRVGGLFFFDVLSVRQFVQYAATQPFAYDADDIAYIWFANYDEQKKEIEHQLTLFIREAKGYLFERIDEIHIQRAYEPAWLAAQLQAAGFGHIKQFSNFTWNEADEESKRICFIAVKL